MEESKNATKRVDCDDYSATNRFVVVASSVQVAPERVFACWGKPQSPRSALRAYLRIFQMLYFDRGRKVKSHRSPSNRGLWDSDLLQ